MGRARIRISAILLVILLIGGLAARIGAFQLTVSPCRLILQLMPGKITEGIINFTGRFDRPTRIRVSLSDWIFQPDGITSLEPAGRNQRSLADWLTVSPAEFIMTGNRVQTVRVRLQPPADPRIAGGYWAAVCFQNVPERAKSGQGAAMATVGRVVTTIYAETGQGVKREGKVTTALLKQSTRADTFTLRASFLNTGNVLLYLKGRFEIREATSGKTVAQVPFADGDLRVLPGGTREVTAEWRGKLTSGRNYVLLALIDYGGRYPAAGQHVFKAP